jgi:hypothetical protein
MTGPAVAVPRRLRLRAGPGTELEQARELWPPGGAAHGLAAGARRLRGHLEGPPAAGWPRGPGRAV